MRFVDRFLVILIGLVFICAVTVLLLVPSAVITALQSVESMSLLLRLVIVVAVNIVILVLLFLQARGRRKPSDGLAVKAAGAFTDVSVESARKMILSAVNAVPDVAAADATVKAVDGRADVDLNIQVSGSDVYIPQKQKEINRALGQVINKQLGLRMRGKPRVHITLEGEEPPLEDEVKMPIPQEVAQTAAISSDSISESAAVAEEAKVGDSEPPAEDAAEDPQKTTANSEPAETKNAWLDSYTTKLPVEDVEETDR